MRAINGWDTSASKAMLYCVICWEKQRKQQHVVMWTGDVGTHLAMRRQRNIAEVAMARRLAVRLYWMWRNDWQYSQWLKFSSHAGQLVTGHGVN